MLIYTFFHISSGCHKKSVGDGEKLLTYLNSVLKVLSGLDIFSRGTKKVKFFWPVLFSILGFSLFRHTCICILIISDNKRQLLVQFFLCNRTFKIRGKATCNSRLVVHILIHVQQRTVFCTVGAAISAENSQLQQAKIITDGVSAF
jgi:hypothetical protein